MLKRFILIISLLATTSFYTFAALPQFNKIYYFGDSLTDIGNYVETQPAPCVNVSAPVTNPVGGTNPGKTWADISAFSFTSTPSKNGGNNYAVSGYQTSQVLAQVQNFINAGHVDPNALYVIWAGANDIIDLIFLAQPPHNPAQVINDGTVLIAGMISKLYQAGARNFLILDVPDISQTPLVASPTPNPQLFIGVLHAYQAQMREACAGWNTQMQQWIQYLAGRLQGIKIYYFDTVKPLDNITANPQAYGFPNQVDGVPNHYTSWCTPGGNPNNPDNYMFFNYIHPTSKLHTVLAQLVRSNAVLVTPGSLSREEKQRYHQLLSAQQRSFIRK